MTLSEQAVRQACDSLANLERVLLNNAPPETPAQAQPSVRPLVPPPPAAPPPAPAPVPALSAEGRKAFFLLDRAAPEAYLQQFRQLRGRLLRLRAALLQQNQPCQSLLVTSPQAGDGKSFTALNLALMLSVVPGCRILLADCNVRRPSYPALFDLPDGPGLRDVLAGAHWRDVARRLPSTELYVAPLGPDPSSSRDPLDFDRLGKWLDRSASDFDWVILDGPALDESPDAEMLSYTADRTLLVMRRGKTSFEAVDRSLARIDRSLLAGVVFNR